MRRKIGSKSVGILNFVNVQKDIAIDKVSFRGICPNHFYLVPERKNVTIMGFTYIINSFQAEMMKDR